MKLIVAVAAMILAATPAVAQQTSPTAPTSTGTAGGIRPDTQDPQPRGGAAMGSMHHHYRHMMRRRHHYRRHHHVMHHHVMHHHVMHHDDANSPSQ